MLRALSRTHPIEGITVNTTLSISSVRPPDTQDRQVLELPAPAERASLSPADRLSLRLGLWLLLRAERAAQKAARRAQPVELQLRRLPRPQERENLALLTYDLHRQLR